MSTYTDLFRECSFWKMELRKLKPHRERWREYVSLSEKIKERTSLLKEMAKVKPNAL